MRKALGYFLISLPFILILFTGLSLIGFEGTLLVIILFCLIVGCIVGGVNLSEKW